MQSGIKMQIQFQILLIQLWIYTVHQKVNSTYLLVIKKFIKLLSIKNKSIDSKIGYNEFEELACIVNSKFINMNHTELVKNIEDFYLDVDANANAQSSLMNMIIKSNKALN